MGFSRATRIIHETNVITYCLTVKQAKIEKQRNYEHGVDTSDSQSTGRLIERRPSEVWSLTMVPMLAIE